MKTKLDYTVRTTRAPGETTDTWTPMIVDRLQPTGLEAVIEKCIDGFFDVWRSILQLLQQSVELKFLRA